VLLPYSGGLYPEQSLRVFQPTVTKSINVYCSTGTGHVFLCRWSPLLGTGIWSKYAVACFKLAQTVDARVYGLGAVQLNSSLLTISVIAVLLPGAFHMALQGQPEYDESSTDYNILKTSHGVREPAFEIRLVLRSSIGCNHSPFQ
jgi:hypothetical protein